MEHRPGFNLTFTVVTIAVVTSHMLCCLPERGDTVNQESGGDFKWGASLCAGGNSLWVRAACCQLEAPKTGRGCAGPTRLPQALSSSTLSDRGPACELAFQTMCREGLGPNPRFSSRETKPAISLQGQPTALPAATRRGWTHQAHDL